MSQSSPMVLLTGAGGQLGHALQATALAQCQVIALTRQQLDICNQDAVMQLVTQLKPDWVINAAAYTAVDRAEQEADLAFAINATAPGYLAEAVAKSGGKLLHISTDFVFDGFASTPYQPEDNPNPLSIYGESKLAGERQVLTILAERGLVVRTAWLYNASSRNFVTTMLRLMRERDEIRVVADQVGTPTATQTLAPMLWQGILQAWQGIYHMTDAGVASWYDFAVAVQHHALRLGLLQRSVPIWPILTAEFPTPAKRPAYSVLDKSKTWQQLKTAPLHWQEQLCQTLKSRS